ncbi:MAG TPA: FUSC family protein [Gammaproteobacteria bacterium]|nr:FUSC family protein [Gammaproteobacteria bacterium]
MIRILPEWAQNERLIHSIKTALACLAGFLVTRTIHFQTMQWVVITTLVVMCAQINVGSVIQKSWMRFLGTLAGSLLAILTLEIAGDDPFIKMMVVLIAAMFFSFIATSTKSYNESGTLGAVTVTIILFGTNPDVQTGIERFLEISLGILIAAIVSQFILPIHAKTHLRKNQAMTIKKIRTFYLALFSSTPSPDNTDTLGNLDEEMVKSLILQRKLAGEARKEKWGNGFNMDDFKQSLWCEKEMIRSIIFMFYAWQKSSCLTIMQHNRELLDNFHEAISNTLETISVGILQNKLFSDKLLVNTDALKQSLNAPIPEKDGKMSVDAFLFCADILVERLDRMIHLLKK